MEYMSDDPPLLPRRFAVEPSDPDYKGYPDELRRRAEEVLNGTNLVEVILYGHLLLEQALEIRIRARLERADVLDNRQFARLSFAQKITIYVGLYDPDDRRVTLLQGFNRLRNRMAHTFADLEDAVSRELPEDQPGATALMRVQDAFMWLAFIELGAIQGLRRMDLWPADRPEADTNVQRQSDEKLHDQPAVDGADN